MSEIESSANSGSSEMKMGYECRWGSPEMKMGFVGHEDQARYWDVVQFEIYEEKN